MAITQDICKSFKQEILVATHNLTAGQHAIRLALYSSTASLDSATGTYTSAGEVASSGSYTAGGSTLTNVTPALSGSVAICDFNDLQYTSATITARGAYMYNQTASNKGIAVLDFGADKTSTAGNFTIVFPTADSSNAIIRIA